MTVTVYGKALGCIQCDRTKVALDKKGIPYTFIDVTESEAAYTYVTTSLGYQQVPVVEVERASGDIDTWSGFRPDKLQGLATRKDAA